MADHAFGDHVDITHKLVRREDFRDSGRAHGRERWKVWKPEPLAAPRTGIVIGKRHLANGRTEWEYEAGVVWHGGERPFPAYLVAIGMHRRPVLVLPEHVHAREHAEPEPEPVEEGPTLLDELADIEVLQK